MLSFMARVYLEKLLCWPLGVFRCAGLARLVACTTTALAKITDQLGNAMFAWRVVSLGTVGTGAVGTTIVVERVNA